MKLPHGKLILVSMAILLVIGATLLRRHLKQSDYPNVQDKQALKSVDIPAAPSTPRPSINSLPGPALVVDQPTVRDLPRPMPDRRARRGSTEQAIDRVSDAGSLEAQIQAIRDLGNFQDPQTIKVLGPALHSHIAEVRKAALEAMREGTVEDPATLAEVRYAVTNDSDPGVRQAALEVLVRYDESAEARSLLEKLASEPRGAYRDFARRELDRMDYEADARSRPDPQIQRVQQQ